MQPLLPNFAVLEIGHSDAVRFCGYILAGVGAEVFTWHPKRRPSSGPVRAVYQQFLAQNKKELVVSSDEESAADAEARLAELASLASILLVDGDAMSEPWLQALMAQKAANVLVVTPFGLTGPLARRSGGDLIASHGGGYAYYLARTRPDLPPLRGPEGQASLFAGLVGAIGALAGGIARQKSGTCRVLDLSEQEATAALLYQEVGDYNNGRLAVGRDGGDAAVAGGLVGLLPCVDGFVLISPREQHQWERLISLVGAQEWVAKPEFSTPTGRLRNWATLQRHLSTWTNHRYKEEVFALAQESQVACFPVNTFTDLGGIEQLDHRGFWTEVAAEKASRVIMPRLPFRIADIQRHEEAPAVRVSLGEALSQARRARAEGGSAPARSGGRASGYPLTGIRVVDFSWVVGGPICTRQLALLGAEVIKIESTSRAEYRTRVSWADGLNSSKRSVTINLRTDEGRELVTELVSRSDVVVENFSTGVMERLGLGYTDLCAAKSDLVMLTMSGLGRTGPGARLVAYGSLLQAYSGWLSHLQPPSLSSTVMGIRPAWTDQVAGAMGAVAILAALWHRDSCGRGAYIDLSMLETLILLQARALADSATGNDAEQVRGNASTEYAPHGCYPCQGRDESVAFAVYNDQQWQTLVDLMGGEEWEGGLSTAAERLARRRQIDERVSAWTRRWRADDLVRTLVARGIPATRSHSLWTVLDDAHMAARGLYQRMSNGELAIGLPWIDSETGRGALTPAPELGADNAHVVDHILNVDPSRYQHLVERGALT